MAYQALLFCADPKTTRVLTGVLQELDFKPETDSEPFEAVKKLTAKHFDAVFVDCDDEQNAALLFKSARNSERNSASLAIAIVSGQAAIAKAFQIGANLVLTKPINVEQTKGTLRVARGLLKKSEQAKSPAAAAPAASNLELPSLSSSSPQAAPPEAAFTLPEPQPALSAAPPAPTMQLQVEEKESVPPLGATEAALLEAMPEQVPRPASGLAFDRIGGKEGGVKPAAEPTVSALESASQPPASFASEKASPGSSLSFGSASAAVPAPAKQTPPPVVEPAAATPKTDATDARPAKKTRSEKKEAEPAPEAAAFSWHEAAREQDESEDKDSRKNLLIAAVLVLAIAAAVYFAWPFLQPTVMSLPFVQKYVTPYLGRLAPQAPSPAPVPARPSPVASTPTVITVPQPAPSDASASGSPETQTAVDATPSADSVPAATPPASAAPKPLPAPLHVSESAMEGLLLQKVQPIYPPEAARLHIEGAVVLQAEIGKDGSIASVKSLRGDPALVPAATDAVRRWKYKPYLVNGQPAEVQTEITVNFDLP